jgi:hypothetical protein
MIDAAATARRPRAAGRSRASNLLDSDSIYLGRRGRIYVRYLVFGFIQLFAPNTWPRSPRRSVCNLS